MKRDEVGVIRYAIRSVDFAGSISFSPYIDGNVANRDSNYNEKFWDMEETGVTAGSGFLKARTKKSGFVTCMTMGYELRMNGLQSEYNTGSNRT